jgi:serine/threonine protein kinase
MIEAWANLVGRDRAVRELESTIRTFGSLAMAGRALHMTKKTLERFRVSFAAMPRTRTKRAATDPRQLKIVGLRVARQPFAEGTSSSIYRAVLTKPKFELPAGADVAIKVIKPAMLTKVNEPKRIRREFKIGSSIRHPNLIRVFELVEAPAKDIPFALVIEYIDGPMLSSLIQSGGVNDPVAMAGGLAAAVEALHSQEILHRDIKTDNILVGANGTVKLIDYGVSKIPDEAQFTVTHEFLGTKRYASPQAIEGRQPSKEDDLYSLGAVFYEMFFGKPIFDGIDNPAQLIDAIRVKSPDVLQNSLTSRESKIPYRIRLLIHRLLAKEARIRPGIKEARSWIESTSSVEYVKFLEDSYRMSFKQSHQQPVTSNTSFFARCEVCNEAYLLGGQDLEVKGIEPEQLNRSLQRSGTVRVAWPCGSCSQPFSMSQVTNRPQKYMVVKRL